MGTLFYYEIWRHDPGDLVNVSVTCALRGLEDTVSKLGHKLYFEMQITSFLLDLSRGCQR